MDNKQSHSKLAASNKNQVTVAEQKTYSGILPPPADLAEYEVIKEGFADRMLAMAEKEQASRHVLQKIALEGEVKLKTDAISYLNRGLLIGLLAVIVVAIVCCYIAYLGNTLVAGGTLAITVALAGIFVIRNYKKDENKEDSNLPTTDINK